MNSTQSIQERLKLKRTPLDVWSTSEKLALASAVLRSGDQNWSCVSRTIKPYGEANRPPDWFSQKNCALQYGSLLETVDAPKRKKRSIGSTEKSDGETAEENIVRMLTEKYMLELRKKKEEDRANYLKKLAIVKAIERAELAEQYPLLLQEIEDAKVRAEHEKESHLRWLKEREERKLEVERSWKPISHHSSLRRASSLSDPSSDADSPMSEPLNVDVPDELVKPTPTSPLLTSLLKSPASAANSASSILHSAITSPLRGTSPTISSLLNTPGNHIANIGTPSTTLSPNIKSLFSNALGSHSEDVKVLTPSPSQGAPTLSMLLELPISNPGKPLPMLQPPAPPPYSEPPPPYSLATEYLQKQKAQAAAAALKIKCDDSVSPLSSPVKILPILVSPEPVIDTSEIIVDASDLAGIEKVKEELIESFNALTAAAANTTDHNYVEVQEKIEVLVPEAEKEPEPMKIETPPDIIEEVVAAAAEKPKTEKKTDLDVFDFDDEACAEVEESTRGYLKTRLAKKDAENQRSSINESPTKREIEDLLVESDTETSLPEESIASVQTVNEASVDSDIAEVIKEDTTVSANNEQIEEDSSEEKIDDIPLQERIEKVEEPIAEVKQDEAPIENVKPPVKENTPSPEKERPVEVPEIKVEETAEVQQVELDTSAADEEKTAVAKSIKAKRRVTASLSASDSIPSSPMNNTDDEKELRSWKKSSNLMLTSLLGHKSASIFSKPITDDQAPCYSSLIKRPMDLGTIKKNIDTGAIRSTEELSLDVYLMLMNATMYNGWDSMVYSEAFDMFKVAEDSISLLCQAKDDNIPARRETRKQDRKLPSTPNVTGEKQDIGRKRQSSMSTPGSSRRKRQKVE